MDKEHRDFWAYDLSLTPEQSKQIARRALELQNADFKYYFFNDNCTHRLRDLLSQVTGTPIAYDNGLWFMPIQMLQGLGRQPKLLKNIRFLPSSKTRLLTLIQHMSPKERHALNALFEAPSDSMAELTAPEQKKF